MGEREEGMVLVNVLLIVALASAVVMIMLSGEDAAIDRSTRLREAAQALSYARGGELSAIAALRRDGLAAPETDNLSEPWAALAQRPVRIVGGSFALSIADAQARFNINALARGDVQSRATFDQIVAALGLPAVVGTRAAALIALTGPLADLGELSRAGVSDAQIAQMASLITALPSEASINLNTVGEPLLAVLLGDPVAARILTSRRTARGYLVGADFTSARTLPPLGTGFTSNLFWVRTRVTIGQTVQQEVSLLWRHRAGGTVLVDAISRWRGAAAPIQAPPLPSQ